MTVCRSCGKELSDEARFCTHCGAPVYPAVQSTPTPDPAVQSTPTPDEAPPAVTVPSEAAPAPAAPSAPEATPAPRSKAPLLIVLGALALVAVIAGAAFLLRGAPATATALHYGQRAAATVAPTALIVPSNAQGEPLERYVVTVRDARDAQGEPVEAAAGRLLEAEGADGFSMDELFDSDCPDGTYWIEVEDEDGTVWPLPPVVVTPEGPDDTVHVEPETEADAGADAAFLDKIHELVEEHGEPSITATEIESPGGVSWVSGVGGLAYAELIDFGDGVERLVTAYPSATGLGSLVAADGSSTCTVEVWEYDEETSTVVAACDPFECNKVDRGGNVIADVELSVVDAGDMRYLLVEHYIGNGGMFDTVQVFGVDEEGAFGELCHATGFTYDSASGKNAFSTEGPMDAAEFSALFRTRGWDDPKLPAVALSWEGYVYTREEALQGTKGSIGENEMLEIRTPANIISCTKSTIAELEYRCETGGAIGSRVAFSISTDGITFAHDTYGSGADEPDGTAEATFTYVQVSCDAPVSAAETLSEQFKARAEETAKRSETWSFDEADGVMPIAYDQTCTYAKDGVLGIEINRYDTGWGPHGMAMVTGEIYDVATGRELSPWDVAGMTRREFIDEALDAVRANERTRPAPLDSLLEAEMRSEVIDIINNHGCLLREDGIYLYIPSYSLGHAYADGAATVQVLAFE